MMTGDVAAEDQGEFVGLTNGAIGVEEPLLESVDGGTTTEDQIVAKFYLSEKQPVLNPGVLSLLGGEKGGEAGQPFLCTGDQIVGREQRLLDANRTIGQPNKLTLIFGRRITRHHAGKLQTVIEDLNLPNPVIRSHYRKGFIKQYVRDRFLLRTESATNNVSTDYGIGKAVDNLPELRKRLDGILDRYLDVQQDILETFVDREQLRKLTQPTLLPNGRRIPGLKLDHPRQLALMHSLVRFCYLAAEGTFTTPDLYPQTLQTLKMAPEEYKLGSLRYDLWKLRAKGLVEKIPHSRRYRLLPHGYQICLVFLKLYDRLCAPLTAAILQPFAADQSIPKERITALDRRYTAVLHALDDLVDAVGLKAA